MTRIRDIANILSSSTSMATDDEVTSAISAQFAAGKNKIINGNMLIDQRASTTTVNSAAGTYTLDRWRAFGQTSDGVFTVTQDSSSPSEFSKSLKVTVTTADTNITSSQTYQMGQIIEGSNTIDLAWGTSAAKSAILSFWVKSSVTGTFGGGLRNSGSSRSYPFSYTINTADTWEKKTVTIGAETTGTWVKDAGSGIRMDFSLGAGSNFLGTAGAWNTNNNNGATGQTNIIATVNATWFITGVQLEAGSTATNFSLATGTFATELAACQRYYQTSFDLGQTPAHNGSYYGEMTLSCVNGGFSTNSYGAILFPTKMRTAPTVNIWNTRNASVSGNSARFYNSGTAYETSSIDMGITTSSSHGMTFKGTNIGSSAIVFFGYSASAEL
jgi:hypothetical protein